VKTRGEVQLEGGFLGAIVVSMDRAVATWRSQVIGPRLSGGGKNSFQRIDVCLKGGKPIHGNARPLENPLTRGKDPKFELKRTPEGRKQPRVEGAWACGSESGRVEEKGE